MGVIGGTYANVPVRWSMGSLAVLHQCVTPTEAFYMYAVGPNTRGFPASGLDPIAVSTLTVLYSVDCYVHPDELVVFIWVWYLL